MNTLYMLQEQYETPPDDDDPCGFCSHHHCVKCIHNPKNEPDGDAYEERKLSDD